jgi:Icc-related predicted phosphoesterase
MPSIRAAWIWHELITDSNNPVMKVLFTTDFHGESRWYRWVSEVASRFDLVCIAGDLTEYTTQTATICQVAWLLNWVETFPCRDTTLALCSGNHDTIDLSASALAETIFPKSPENERMRKLKQALTDGFWMDHLKIHESILVDGDVRVVWGREGDYLLVQCIPHWQARAQEDAIRKAWEDAAKLRDSEKMPWLVLHHEPPHDGSDSSTYRGNVPLRNWIEYYRPDYVVSGHLHNNPFRSQEFCQRIGNTWCFNPGSRFNSDIPAHVILDTQTHRAQWIATEGNSAEIKIQSLIF